MINKPIETYSKVLTTYYLRYSLLYNYTTYTEVFNRKKNYITTHPILPTKSSLKVLVLISRNLKE